MAASASIRAGYRGAVNNGALRVLLVGNYLPDAQPSMQRFATLLQNELSAAGVDVEVTRPSQIVGRGYTAQPGFRKWLGYVDKYLLFPPALWRTTAANRTRPSIVHICDHSNAPYVRVLGRVPHVVTCHDLLAVRAARNEFPYVTTGRAGRRLQQAITAGLRCAAYVACDSEATRDDVKRIVGLPAEQVGVVRPAVAEQFLPLDATELRARLGHVWPRGRSVDPYILHVGGNNWYKNRRGVIEIYARAVARQPQMPILVLAGSALPSDLVRLITEHGLDERVVSLVGVPDEGLAALYGSAKLLLFPSLAEGYGWPVLEAMACGCPVVTSHRPPLTELGGTDAHYVDPDEVEEAAGVLIDALNESAEARTKRVSGGLERIKKLRAQTMASAYLKIYRKLIDGR